MSKTPIFFLVVFFIFSVIAYTVPSVWFIYFPKDFIVFLALFSFSFQLIVSFFLMRKYTSIDPSLTMINSGQDRIRMTRSPKFPFLKGAVTVPILLLGSFLLMVFFPIRNLNLGDGVLLLEHVALEAKNFGHHLTMDEILEALIHSVLFAKFSSFFATPMEVYRLVSTVCGFFAIGILFFYFRKIKIPLVGYYLVLTSGGMYLFHGYSENYTIITTVLWFYILYAMNSIREGKNRNLPALIPICIIACSLILLHLVSGYLLFSLIYLCYHFSDEGKFIRNAVICTIISLCILAPVFIYFTFISEVRFDFSQTHITNPKFYPILKIISTNHLRDILFCIIGSAFLPFIMLLYFALFYREDVKRVLQRKEIHFLLFILLGFSIHGFVHYPQLGFPADWDLLAFFWTPLAFLSAIIFTEIERQKVEQAWIRQAHHESLPVLRTGKDAYPTINSIALNVAFKPELMPILLFAGILFIMNAVYLNNPDEHKMKELKNSMERINRYSNLEESKFLGKVKPEYKKFYLQVSFFLYESKEKIEEKYKFDAEISQKLLEENKLFKEELEKNIDDVKAKWQKDFYSRMTNYHIEYLKFLQKK